jgi:hypothetical protein
MPSTTLQVTLGAAAAAIAGTIYVLVHERRRKDKARRRLESESSEGGTSSSAGSSSATVISRDRLIGILEESSTAAYQLIEQTRKMVFAKHEQTGMSLEKVVEELQKDFEVAMETVVTAIRKNHGVTEQQMTQAMVANQADQEVQTAMATLREAMAGKAPPSRPQQDTAKRAVRRTTGKARRKG